MKRLLLDVLSSRSRSVSLFSLSFLCLCLCLSFSLTLLPCSLQLYPPIHTDTHIHAHSRSLSLVIIETGTTVLHIFFFYKQKNTTLKKQNMHACLILHQTSAGDRSFLSIMPFAILSNLPHPLRSHCVLRLTGQCVKLHTHIYISIKK